jgi:hypothetical protein
MVPLCKRASRRPVVTDTFRWRDLTLRVDHVPDVINVGWSHLELVVLEPADAPLPLGYAQLFVHEMEEDALVAAGGPVTFLTAWLDRVGTSPAYERALFRWRQKELLLR